MSSDLVPGLEGSTIMEQMQKVFEPPGGYADRLEGERHPYFKRPGKGHNHGTCDSCREGGALICCDSCPASFHFQCHDPPLEDEDIPEGDWMCLKCYASKPEAALLVVEDKNALEETQVESKSGRSAGNSEPAAGSSGLSKGGGPVGPEKDKEWTPKKRKTEELESSGGGTDSFPDDAEESYRPRRATRNKKQRLYNDLSTTEDELSEAEAGEYKNLRLDSRGRIKKGRLTYLEIYAEHLKRKPKIHLETLKSQDEGANDRSTTLRVFDLLIAAANLQNAEEFHLPKNICVPEKFPYAWKWSTDDKKVRNSVPDGDNDSLCSQPMRGSRRTKLCHVCVKSARLGPLVQCDFCPLLFHMDCLDPPLSEVPSDVWMCPNHVENFLDSHLLTSTRVTKRVELWERYANQPIDTHAVKLDFMKKCSKLKNPHFRPRRARTVAAKFSVVVPEYVKQQYRYPPSLLPGPAHDDRWMDPSFRRRQEMHSAFVGPSPPSAPIAPVENEAAPTQSQPEAEQKISDPKSNEEEAKTQESSTEDEAKDDNVPGPSDQEVDKPSGEDGSRDSSVQSPTPPKIDPVTDFESLIESEVLAARAEEARRREKRIQKGKPTEDELEWLASMVSLQSELLKQKISDEDHEILEVPTSRSNIDYLPSSKRTAKESISEPKIKEEQDTVSEAPTETKPTEKEDRNENELLRDLLNKYLAKNKDVSSLDPLVTKYLASQQLAKLLPATPPELAVCPVKARASLTPVGSRIKPFYLQFRSLDIGIGPSAQLNLLNYGHCNYLSDRHANLFYDELGGHYELVNYSRHGVVVDQVTYNLDTEVVATRVDRRLKENSDDKSSILTGIIKLDPKLSVMAPSPMISGDSMTSSTRCYCDRSSGLNVLQTETAGCEGSAVLQHGSKIQFGCLNFVFAVL